jgi:hypothetical protein
MMNKTVLHQEKVIFVEIMKDVVQAMEVDPPPLTTLVVTIKVSRKKNKEQIPTTTMIRRRGPHHHNGPFSSIISKCRIPRLWRNPQSLKLMTGPQTHMRM